MTEVTDGHLAVEGQKVALVTGANGVIGKAIAEGIAAQPDYAVVLVCRDEAKAEAAVADVQSRTGNRNVCHTRVDLARKGEVEALAGRWRSAVHVLVNNAAVTPRSREETPDNIERQLATNVLGYLWMVQAFAPKLREARQARVVNVASYWAGGLELDDLEFKRRGYDNDSAYRQSKQANRMLSAALAGQFQGTGVTVNACHPGDVVSTLSRNLGFGGADTPQQAADTPVWLATSADVAGANGRYFERRTQTECRFSADSGRVAALFEKCSLY